MKIRPNVLYVVETDKTAYLGRVEVQSDVYKIKTGYTGNPPKVKIEDVVAVTPADRHPDVVVG